MGKEGAQGCGRSKAARMSAASEEEQRRVSSLMT